MTKFLSKLFISSFEEISKPVLFLCISFIIKCWFQSVLQSLANSVERNTDFGWHYLNFISIADTNHDWTNGRASQKGEQLQTFVGLSKISILLFMVKLVF